MNEKACGTGNGGFKEAVCIHTDKVYDSCRDKDCLENIRVYLTADGQCVVDRAINVKCTKAEIIWVFSDIEPVPFNRGFYSVDLKYFFKITLAVFTGLGRPTEVEGLATFDKKVILFGSEGNAKVSKFCKVGCDGSFTGDLYASTLVTEDGAAFEGTLHLKPAKTVPVFDFSVPQEETAAPVSGLSEAAAPGEDPFI